MNKLILNIIYTIALVLLTAYDLFATNWYCNGALTTSTNTGTSWTNAWESFADINWASIAAGDYLYISGGTDSLIYYEQLIPQCRGTAQNRITIIAGKYSPSPSGHSGRVIIDGGGVRSSSILFDDYGGTAPTYITVKGFETRYGDGGIEANIDAARGVSRGCIIDSCRITAFYDLAGVYIKGHFDSSVVQNCYIETMDTPGQTDCFHYNGANNGTYDPIFNVIHDNFIRNNNQDLLAHNDAIQGVDGSGYIIYNNIVINDSVWSTEGGGVPFIVTSNDWNNDNDPPNIWFNNFLYMGGPWYENASPGFAMWARHDGGAGGNKSAPTFIFNNTVVTNGPQIGGLENQYRVDLFINNIIAQWSQEGFREDYGYGWYPPFGIMTNIDGGNEDQDSIRFNMIWREDSTTTGIFGWGTAAAIDYHDGTSGQISTWAQWVSKGAGGDTTGWFRDPLFVSQIGREPDQGAIRPDLKSNSPAIDVGKDLTSLYNYFISEYGIDLPEMFYDIYGTSRDASWDVGAYEYTTGGWTPPDTTPAFSFTALTGRELNTEYVASSTFSGADSTFHVWTTTGAEFKIGTLGAYSTAMKTAVNGDVVYVKNQSSASYSTKTTETIYAGNIVTGQNFDVTTKASPPSGNGGLLKFSNGKVAIQPNGRMIIVR